jgi:chromosome partitioning protein
MPIRKALLPPGGMLERWTCQPWRRPTLAELPAKLKALEAAGYAFALVDTPPAITEAIRDVVKTADLVLIPVKPSPHDLRSVGGTVEIVQGQGKSFAFVVTQAKHGALLTVQAMAALSAHGQVAPVILHDRVDYAASMTDGRTVQETDPKGRSAGEVTDLWKIVLEPKARKHER